MEDTNAKLNSTTAGYGLAAAIAILFNIGLVWAKESYPSLNAAMKAALGHHWITHGVSVVLVFLVLGFLLSRMPLARRLSGGALSWIILIATLMGGLGIVGWFYIVG